MSMSELLWKAITNNNIESINETINKGADPNQKYKNTLPLGWSIKSHHLEATRILLSRGADPNPIIHTTPLILCIKNKQLEIAKCLLENGANICDSGDTGKTPLMWAIEKQDTEMIQLLLDHGAEPTTYLCLMEAIRRDNLKIICLLIEKCPTLNFYDKEGLTPLILCLKQKDVDFKIVDELIKNGADVDKPSSKGDTPITLAVCSARWDLVELLLKNGAHTDTSCLVKCIKTGDINLVREIMKYKIDINKCDKEGNFPVMSAIEMRNLEILQWLVEKGANLDISDKNEDSPFLKAVRSVNFKMVEYLVKLGVDVDQRDKNGETALAISLSRYDFNTFEFLMKSGANLDLARDKIKEMSEKNIEFSIHLEFLKNKIYMELGGMKGHEEAED